jgi:enamine deaminase RidA (YjgF/YER057c/UK114 family)
VSGQTSNDASGAPMHAGDLAAQFKLPWENLVEFLAAADMQPENIVRLNFYTTDLDAFMAKAGELVPIFASAGCKPVSTLLGVTHLFQPSIMIEFEATGVARLSGAPRLQSAASGKCLSGGSAKSGGQVKL